MNGLSLFLLLSALLASPALAADAAPDLLRGAAPGPCAAAMAGPDYVPGSDAAGNPVARADEGASRVPVPPQVAMPLPGNNHGHDPAPNSAYIQLDGQKLDPLLNPAPCQPSGQLPVPQPH